MDSHIRSSISRLICDMSAQQEDVSKNCSLWKPSAAKLADMELKYASPVSVSMKGDVAHCHQCHFSSVLKLRMFPQGVAGLGTIRTIWKGFILSESPVDGLRNHLG